MNAKRIITILAVAIGLLYGNLAPASAAPANAGGGTLVGDVTFTGKRVPPLNTPCVDVSFTFEVQATITLANSAQAQGVWTLPNSLTASKLTGSGASDCENATVGGGDLTVNAITATNQVTTGTLSCSSLNGAYTRTGTDLKAVLGGDCAINTHAAGRVAIHVRAEVVPTASNGITTGVSQASFTGTFMVIPAEGS